MTKCCNSSHPDHSKEISRLNRIAGQIEGIKKMIEDNRYCPDIMTQLKAIQSATKAVESSILQKHLESCVKDAFNSKDKKQTEEKINELVSLFKKQ